MPHKGPTQRSGIYTTLLETPDCPRRRLLCYIYVGALCIYYISAMYLIYVYSNTIYKHYTVLSTVYVWGMGEFPHFLKNPPTFEKCQFWGGTSHPQNFAQILERIPKICLKYAQKNRLRQAN